MFFAGWVFLVFVGFCFFFFSVHHGLIFLPSEWKCFFKSVVGNFCALQPWGGLQYVYVCVEWYRK